MTNEEKRICAERLFDEIGLIDDRFIAEAASPYRIKKRRTLLKQFAILGVSIAVALSLLVGIFAIGMLAVDTFTKDSKNDSYDGEENISTMPENSFNEADATLSDRLDAMRTETDSLRVSADDIDLFGGSAMVVWKFRDEADYRVRAISSGNAETLSAALNKNNGERVDGETDGALEGIWITLGDGRVMSPCLENTPGNVGYGEIFDYAPEYEPSTEFTDQLCDIIS